MSLFDRMKKNVEESRREIDSNDKDLMGLVQDINTIYGIGNQNNMKKSEYLRAAIGWVYGCVGVISDELAGINLTMKTIKNGEQVEIDDHPAMDLIYQANNVTTKFDLIKLTFQYLELTGEAPWYISFKDGKPDSILLLRPDRLTIKPGKDGEIIGGYKYRVYGQGGFHELDLEAEEVVFFRYPDPDEPVRGKGPLQAAAITYDLDNDAEKWNSKFFRNSATPDIVLQTENKLTKETRDRLQRKLEDKYRGIDNSHKTMVLEAGLKVEKLNISQKDMDFIEQQRFSRDKILAIFRVPRTALGITDDVNRANAEATDYVFAKRTIKPKMIGFVEQLNEFLLPLYPDTENIVFDFEDPVPENVDQQIAKATAGIQGGYMTINEARQAVGLDPIDGGDIIREPMTMTPIEESTSGISSKRGKNKKASTGQRHYINARTRSKKEDAKKRQVIKTMVQEALTPLIYDNLKKKYALQFSRKALLKTKLFSGTPEEQLKEKYSFQKKQLDLEDDYMPKVISKLNSVFKSQEEIILRALDNDVKLKLDTNVETLRYQEKLKPVMTDILRDQSKQTFQLLGQSKSFFDSKAKGQTFIQRLTGYFDDRIFKLAPQLVRETNDKLQRQFQEAVEAKEGIPQIKTRIRTLFGEMEVYRSERIARTELSRATSFSTEETYKESGVVEAKEWLTNIDERTDDECIDMNGKVISLGKNFFDKGDKFGDLDMSYESIKAPPLHINCRCTLIPVVGNPFIEGQWRPSMKADQAREFVKDSKFKSTLVHGTTNRAAMNIEKNGFNLSTHDIGEGVYFSSNPKEAAKYARDAVLKAGGKGEASVMNVKINAKTYKAFQSTEDYIKAIEREFGPISNASATAFLKKYDVVEIRDIDYFIVNDPKKIINILPK